jgi:hypothetical protein
MPSLVERAIYFEKQARHLVGRVKHGEHDPLVHPILLRKARHYLIIARGLRLRATS